MPHVVGETNVSKAFRTGRVQYADGRTSWKPFRQILLLFLHTYCCITQIAVPKCRFVLQLNYKFYLIVRKLTMRNFAWTQWHKLTRRHYWRHRRMCVVVGDWLRSLKLFWDLHIFQHVNKYIYEPETTLKQLQNNPKTFWNCFSVLFHM